MSKEETGCGKSRVELFKSWVREWKFLLFLLSVGRKLEEKKTLFLVGIICEKHVESGDPK